jgi:hypothetical protein
MNCPNCQTKLVEYPVNYSYIAQDCFHCHYFYSGWFEEKLISYVVYLQVEDRIYELHYHQNDGFTSLNFNIRLDGEIIDIWKLIN